MTDKDIQKQIDEINRKLDVIQECAVQQKLRSQRMDDLVADLSVIGKDAFKSTVAELDNQGIELNIDDIKYLLFKLIKNIDKFTYILATLESAHDLMQDLSPVAREIIIDFIKKLHELEQKGYFEFFRELTAIIDNIVVHYTAEDARLLAENIVSILDTIKKMTQPEMLSALNNAVSIYQKLDVEDIPEYSVWKAMKELRTPEMKKGIGFLITFLKNMSMEEKKQVNQKD
jgi:uncharacterized protein YjgD (DUF1641 family)